MTGHLLGHYVVLDKLGSGGMGEVYVAQDTKLERRVALKLLRPEVADSPDRRARFRREAKAAAALNHPNIVHLYSVEEIDGLLFMTMELVQGQSLRQLLKARVPLPVPTLLAFGTQIAEGLACAHAAGILHRDLKPANIVIAEHDRVKILDFGLAKLFNPGSAWDPEAPTLASLEESTPGTTFGTAGYMSPEQALGKTLDARTDLFSLGVVLFEMATGRAPFEGETLAAVFDQLLNRRVASAQALNPAVSAPLAAIIEKALEKEPERRYRSALDLLQDLKRIGSADARAAIPARAAAVAATDMPSSIVVLPFVDMSPAKDQEYFCHGITDEIISTLTRVPGLRVISRTSAFAFQARNLDVTEIGRLLRVGAALEGSVRKDGNRVRVTAQLVDAGDGYQLWSKRFDRQLSDVFAIQDEIAALIVQELRRGLTGASGGGVGDAATGKRSALDHEAHDAYLKGMYALHQWTEQSMPKAIAHFREAIAHDPSFAPAYAALAEGHVWLYSSLGILPAHETIPQARHAVQQAIELDPTLAEAYKVRGLIAMDHDWDRRGVEEAFTRALELGPGSAATHLWNAWRLVLFERQHHRALVELEEAERLDPLDLQTKTLIGYVHTYHHDLDRAVEQFAKVVAIEPSFAFAHYALGDAYTHRGEYDRAFAAFERAIELGGRSANSLAALGYAHGCAGHRDRAEALLAELLARKENTYVSAMWIALLHLGLSNLESLFHWLDRAFEERDGSLILITAALEFDPVRDDPRFTSLLGRMGLGYLTQSRTARGAERV